MRNIYYSKKFYLLYKQYITIVPQAVAQLTEVLFSIPWGHHRYLMDRFGNEPAKAFFYVRKTMEEGWSRDMLLNCRVNKQVQNYKKCLKNSTFGEEKFNFSLGLLLILA